MTGTPPSVSCVLNVFRRPESLVRQLAAIDRQTVPVEAVFVWQNGSDYKIPTEVDARATLARCSRNLGVWARFAFALNVESEYVCMLDDDTIPGRRWIENCLATMESDQGLLGTRGMRFRSSLSYHHAEEVGWRSPNADVRRVDIVGHAWFFRREWLNDFWSEPPVVPADRLRGEDIHFSYALQKRRGLGTYVPPHPADEPEFWGSQPETGLNLGLGRESISGQTGAMDAFQTVYRAYVKSGFQLCGAGTRIDNAVAVAATVARSDRVARLQKRLPLVQRVRRIGASLFSASDTQSGSGGSEETGSR